jgi:hypothetical protein
MNPTTFLSRALIFLWRILCFWVAFTHEDNLDDSTSQCNPQVQTPHPSGEREGSDGLDLEERLSKSTVGNNTECIMITRKFHTTSLCGH